MSRRAVIAVLAVGLATCGALAGEIIYTVRPGESASSIARDHYGEIDLGVLLLEYNGRSGTMIRVGEKLRIPHCDVHIVESGDSWSSLALRYLGRAKAYPAVAALNGLSRQASLRIGDHIVFPVPLEHRLEPGETLAGLAERYYGDTDLSAALSDFNEIEDPRRLSIGQMLQIPVMSLVLRADRRSDVVEKAPEAAPQVTSKVIDEVPTAEPPPAEVAVEAAPEPESEPPAPAQFEKGIRAAGRAYERGDYTVARRMLESLRGEVRADGTPAERQEVLSLLSFVYVAFDLPGKACANYRALAAPPELDPDLVSPKIRETLSNCSDG